MSKKVTYNFEELGITFTKIPEQQAHAGLFELPPDFPRRELSGQWVLQEAVRSMEQRQPMPQVGAMAPGLTVWMGEDGKGKIKIVVDGKGRKHVLMYRPRKVQEAINALYGNVTKMLHNRNVKGETISANEQQDPGMLSESRLREEGQGDNNISESLMALNEVKKPEDAVAVET